MRSGNSFLGASLGHEGTLKSLAHFRPEFQTEVRILDEFIQFLLHGIFDDLLEILRR